MKYFKYLLFLLILIPVNAWAYNKAVVDITKMSIEDISEALDKGYLTSELLTLLYLDRIEEYDREFNAIREINSEALNDAKRLDEERKEGNIRGPLHGIPILVKTNIDVRGIPTTAGAKALSDNYPKSDAEVIKRLKEAGVIILASTNMSEFAFKASESNSSYGSVKNAFNTDYTPYGSSGGSAVGVALSFGAASLGTDTNSSVRVPASASGLVGLRPTFGIISMDGIIPYDINRDVVGILSKTVNDNRIILDVISDYNKDIDKKELKIGVINSYLNGNESKNSVNGKTAEKIVDLTKNSINLLAENGVDIIYIEELVNNNYLSMARNTMTGGSFCKGFNNYISNTTGKIRNFNDLTYASGHIYSLAGYLKECTGYSESKKIENQKQAFLDHILEVMEENNVDVIMYPTVKNEILKLNASGLVAPGSFLGSVIGFPSITVPIGYIDEFPYGIEIMGKKESEELLYKVASMLESLNGLEVVNSPLAPSLYDIPLYVEDLKKLYEKYYAEEKYQEAIKMTRDYFLNYNSNDKEDNQLNAQNLIKMYEIDNENRYKIILLVFMILDIILVILVFCKVVMTIKRNIFLYK